MNNISLMRPLIALILLCSLSACMLAPTDDDTQESPITMQKPEESTEHLGTGVELASLADESIELIETAEAKSLGLYSMPDESEPHEATWLQWPHEYQYGRTYRDRLDSTWVEMTRALV